MKNILLTILFVCAAISVAAQTDYDNGFNQVDEEGNITRVDGSRGGRDSLHSDKEIPKGLKVWTVDERFGDRRVAEVDTMSYMFMKNMFTTGMRGEYNTTGNMGAPRIARIYADRSDNQQFIFTQPYDYFVRPVGDFHFTNTYSPITNVTFNSCGNRTNGEDDLKALFAVNAGKRIGVGFRFDYKYARGYYDSQATSHFGYTMWGSYLGDRYQAHLLMSTNHQKVTENGGITDDNYITHPEIFNESFQTNEIPHVLSENWNRNDNQHIFFSHRYSLGFNRKVPMTEEEIKARKFAMASKKENDARKAKEKARKKAERRGEEFNEDKFDKTGSFAGRPENATIAGDEKEIADSVAKGGGRIAVNGKAAADSLIAKTEKEKEDTSWMKNEYVPVTSFIHTVKLDHYNRIFEAYDTPADYYLYEYYNVGRLTGDSIYDRTRHYDLKNTFAIALLEGFNKWAKSGLKVFASHDLRHFELPDGIGGMTKYNENSVYVGGELNKTQGQVFHYNVVGELGVAGEDAGTFKVDANADVNFRLWGDTVRLAASGFVHHSTPSFYFRHYHSRHFWWDNDLDKEIHSRVQGVFSLKRTKTRLRVAFDELTNYTYLQQTYNVDDSYNYTGLTVAAKQESSPISVITAELSQNLRLGPLNWDNVVTFQKSTNDDVLPLPTINVYTNLFFRFKIAKVLKTDLGADATFFTSYYAPEYAPALGSYAVQGGGTNQRTKIGSYPLINAYANFHLKHARFFVMYSHANTGSFNKGYFFTPHYPLNQSIFRFGISWNFFN